MENKICKRHISREGVGCVWVFMSMFDFRHGGSNQKLLMDKKRGSKRILGTTKIEKQLTCDCEIDSEVEMQSVKRLIEDEIDEKIQQKCDFECRGGTKARNRKRRSRTCSKTSEDIDVLVACDDDDQCRRISKSEADSINDDSEEKFSELIKRLIAQKESEIESCKNLLNAFQDLDSKQESSLPVNVTSSSKESRSSSQCTQTIVILKTEPNRSDSKGNKTKNRGFGSRFILSRIRRRLKSSVGKNASHDSAQECCLGKEIETTSGRLVSDGEIPETSIRGSEESKKSMSGIYIAAKKHLSEMLAEGDIDVVDSPDKEKPRILGKILALPEFSTPETSPRMTLTHDNFACDSKPLVLDSNKHEETSSTIDMPAPKDTEKEEEERTVLDSLSEASSSSIIQQDGYVDEDKHKKLLEKRTHSPCSPPNSPVRMSECQENATDAPGKSSPVSVLEPLFTDDETSPNSSRCSSVEMRMQPLRIIFDEIDSPRPDKENDVKTRMDDKELALAYIEAIVKSSELNWEELLARSFYSEQLLEQALMEDIDFCSTNLCRDKKLLFDCINEVLMEFSGHGPWISFVKPAVRFFPEMENAVEVIQEEVYWHLLPLPSPHTLDQIVKKDLAKAGIWMDLRFDIGCIGSETGEVILDELLEEIIRNFTDLFQDDETIRQKLIT